MCALFTQTMQQIMNHTAASLKCCRVLNFILQLYFSFEHFSAFKIHIAEFQGSTYTL